MCGATKIAHFFASRYTPTNPWILVASCGNMGNISCGIALFLSFFARYLIRKAPCPFSGWKGFLGQREKAEALEWYNDALDPGNANWLALSLAVTRGDSARDNDQF